MRLSCEFQWFLTITKQNFYKIYYISIYFIYHTNSINLCTFIFSNGFFFNFPKTFNIKYKNEGNLFVNINRNYFFKTCIFYFFNSLENL